LDIDVNKILVTTYITSENDDYHWIPLEPLINLRDKILIMEPVKFCQSCSMPIDNIEMRGTESHGSKSEEYCKYCYANGSFINPGMKIDEMKGIVKTQLEKMHSPHLVIDKAISILPELKRWKTSIEN
jgi:hypothetical protein